jgi:CheY-like chemotaxis protein
MRATEREIAVDFAAVPLELADVVKDALISALEGAALAHVLLVDANTERRAPFAAVLRRAGCRVAEASTPLEAIAHLGHSAIHSWVVAIADTAPMSTAEGLRQFLAEREEPVDVRLLNHHSPTSALSWFMTAARVTG